MQNVAILVIQFTTERQTAGGTIHLCSETNFRHLDELFMNVSKQIMKCCKNMWEPGQLIQCRHYSIRVGRAGFDSQQTQRFLFCSTLLPQTTRSSIQWRLFPQG